jgi:hypothetical protein
VLPRLPLVNEDGVIKPKLVAIFFRRFGPVANKSITELLIK